MTEAAKNAVVAVAATGDKYRTPALLVAGSIVVGSIVYFGYKLYEAKEGAERDAGDIPFVPDSVLDKSFSKSIDSGPSARSIIQILTDNQDETSTQITQQMVSAYLQAHGQDTSDANVKSVFEQLILLSQAKKGADYDELEEGVAYATGYANPTFVADQWRKANQDQYDEPPSWSDQENARNPHQVAQDANIFKSAAALKNYFSSLAGHDASYKPITGLSVAEYQKVLDAELAKGDTNLNDYYAMLRDAALKQQAANPAAQHAKPAGATKGDAPPQPAPPAPPKGLPPPGAAEAKPHSKPAPAHTPTAAQQAAAGSQVANARAPLRPDTFYYIIFDWSAVDVSKGKLIVTNIIDATAGTMQARVRLERVTDSAAKHWQDAMIVYVKPYGADDNDQVFQIYACNGAKGSNYRGADGTRPVAVTLMQIGDAYGAYNNDGSNKEQAYFTICQGALFGSGDMTGHSTADAVKWSQSLRTVKFNEHNQYTFNAIKNNDWGDYWYLDYSQNLTDMAHAPKVYFTPVDADVQAAYQAKFGLAAST